MKLGDVLTELCLVPGGYPASGRRHARLGGTGYVRRYDDRPRESRWRGQPGFGISADGEEAGARTDLGTHQRDRPQRGDRGQPRRGRRRRAPAAICYWRTTGR
jgi:hypothetical protein